MSKIYRKWIETTWDNDGALRGIDIPYSPDKSISTRLDTIKDSTDQSIRVESIDASPTSEENITKLYTRNGELYLLDENDNEIRLSRQGRLSSITNTKVEKKVEYVVITNDHLTNEYIDLQKVPDPINSVSFSRLGGHTFEYNNHYSMVKPDDNEDYIRLTFDSTVTSLLQVDDVVKISYICPTEQQSNSVEIINNSITLTSTDITNKYITIPNAVYPPESLEFSMNAGSFYFEYTEDFVVKQDSNGEYKILSWAAIDTTVGLESILQENDQVNINYTKVDNTQIRGTEKRVQYVTLDSTDISNKYVDLDYIIAIPEVVECSALAGSEFQYGTSFIVKKGPNGQYTRLTWAAADTTTGLESVLIEGDILRISYMDAVGLIGALRVSGNDIRPSFLQDKIVAGNNINISVSNEGGNEVLTITGAAGLDKEVEYVTLTETNITNKYIDLTSEPVNANEAELTILKGTDQHYGVDYTIVSDGSVVKRLTWDNTVPGGPSTGLVGSLIIGDVLKVSYIRYL